MRLWGVANSGFFLRDHESIIEIATSCQRFRTRQRRVCVIWKHGCILLENIT